jgi:glycine cleavage system regulatory protein
MPEPTTFILTVLGPDRPGLVEKLARAAAANGGNWVESRMCRLGGHFAGIVRIETTAGEAPTLERALSALASDGLRIDLVRERGAAPSPAGREAEISVVGQDRPGIVREIAMALAARAVNVEELSSDCESAPMSGERLFRARFRVQIPAGVQIPALRRELARIGDDLVADISFEPRD